MSVDLIGMLVYNVWQDTPLGPYFRFGKESDFGPQRAVGVIVKQAPTSCNLAVGLSGVVTICWLDRDESDEKKVQEYYESQLSSYVTREDKKEYLYIRDRLLCEWNNDTSNC